MELTIENGRVGQMEKAGKKLGRRAVSGRETTLRLAHSNIALNKVHEVLASGNAVTSWNADVDGDGFNVYGNEKYTLPRGALLHCLDPLE
eukprot:CAMPEP_0198223966 /NCGR_PEP_ID=MMETSP1445-20131203/94815_1 /TAXON_ID=36898 /ORGANISM="Pyramimonas sp., Strain CCMP2087" /LENGTH=89 /DNA_ID=CAMNT_0043902973 /DNA_START=1 /DNA_END=270 /DNA_ORIENTATION=+